MSAVVDAYKIRLGRRVRAARIGAGLSHDRLAERVGTSRQHLIRIEKGVHLPRPAMLAKIAEATGHDSTHFDSDDEQEADPVADLMTAIRRLVREELRAAA